MNDKVYIKDHRQFFSIRGVDLCVTAPAKFDSTTDEMLYDKELDDCAIEKAHDLYREIKGYLSPQSIREIRKSIGISQRDFATLLGWSQTTIVMYENGSLPTNNNNSQLKILHDNPLEIEQYYLQAHALSQRAKDKIEIYLEGLKKFNLENVLKAENIVDWFRVTNVKEMEASEIVEPLSQLKVMKLLYYVQGIAMAKLKHKAFEEEILSWDYGPVIQTVYDKYKGSRSIVSELMEGELPKNLIENYEKINKNQKLVEILNLVQDNFGHLSAISLMKKTHREQPWIATKRNQIIEDRLIKTYFEENFMQILSN